MIISMPNNWEAAKTQHNQHLRSLIRKFVDHNSPKAKNWYSREFVKHIEEAISTDSRAQMEWSIHELHDCQTFLSPAEYADLLDDLKRAFNYKTFTTKPTKKTSSTWSAYALCATSKLLTCPYCNYNYSHTVFRDADGVLRPTIDHFYPKSLYPHLSLTLANLVPSCYSCNCALKGDENFFLKKHLHPFFDPESVTFECYHPTENFLAVLGKFESIKNTLSIELQPRRKCDATQNSVLLFALQQRYEKFNKDGVDFISSQLATEALLGNLSTARRWEPGECLNLKATGIRARLLRFDRAEYKSYPLGKMYADLYDQFYRGLADTTK